MKDEGRRQRIADQNLDRLTGHAAGNIGARYGSGAPIDVLKEDIDRLEFKSVDWDAVIACGQERVRRLRAELGLAA